jgi:lipoyl(octanoyl) transferase
MMNFVNWGVIQYDKAWKQQQVLFDERLKAKASGLTLPDLLVFCEHTPVFTLGKSGQSSNLLVNQQVLKSKGVDYYMIDRGGDITFHGPGQIVCYPIVDLEHFGIGLRRFIEILELAVIQFLSEYHVKGEQVKNATGVWVKSKDQDVYQKICAIGIKSSRFVTMHGLALNINTDLSYYQMINPCGFSDRGVTSLTLETGLKHSMTDCQQKLYDILNKMLKTI